MFNKLSKEPPKGSMQVMIIKWIKAKEKISNIWIWNYIRGSKQNGRIFIFFCIKLKKLHLLHFYVYAEMDTKKTTTFNLSF